MIANMLLKCEKLLFITKYNDKYLKNEDKRKFPLGIEYNF